MDAGRRWRRMRDAIPRRMRVSAGMIEREMEMQSKGQGEGEREREREQRKRGRDRGRERERESETEGERASERARERERENIENRVLRGKREGERDEGEETEKERRERTRRRERSNNRERQRGEKRREERGMATYAEETSGRKCKKGNNAESTQFTALSLSLAPSPLFLCLRPSLSSLLLSRSRSVPAC